MYAFKDGVTVLNADNLNSIIALQPFKIIYEGTEVDGVAGSGVVENSVADYSYCIRFTLLGGSEIGRVELDIDKDGIGADLTVEIRSGMNPTSGDDGTLLKRIVVPKEFMPDPKAWWSVPIGLTGLSIGGQYWLVVQKAGDGINKTDWIGETTPNENYPAYRRSGGSWESTNALHFRVFRGISGQVHHVIEGVNATTYLVYSAGALTKVCQYIPPEDGPGGGIRGILNITYSSGLLTGGD